MAQGRGEGGMRGGLTWCQGGVGGGGGVTFYIENSVKKEWSCGRGLT